MATATPRVTGPVTHPISTRGMSLLDATRRVAQRTETGATLLEVAREVGRVDLYALADELQRLVGYLPEDRGLYPKMKLGEQLLFLAALKGMKPQSASKSLDSWLERFDLGPWRTKKTEELSRGMQQKAQFIATVMHDPQLIILDEPFSGLDPVNTKLLKDVMLELRDRGTTIIFSTHRMEQVEMICDNICLINKAEKVLEGNLQRIKQDYGKNSVLLEYEGDAAFLREAPGVAKLDDYGRYMEIRLLEGQDPQELLQTVSDRLRVNRFEVKEPTLNAIFIDKVGGSHE